MTKVGSMRYGVIFKKAFSNPAIFTRFVKDVTDVDLSIDSVETEKSFEPTVGKVDVRFDLFAQDMKNRVIVDIQHVRYSDHYHRFLHYHCAAILEMISSSDDYKPGMSVYTIVILTSGDKHQKDITVIDFDPHDLKGRPIKEISHKIFFIAPKYLNDETPEPFREWIMAINDSLDEEVDESHYNKQEILNVFKLIKKDIITPKEYAKMKDEYSLGLVMDEKYTKGVEQGVKQGVATTIAKMKEAGILSENQLAQAASLLGITDISQL